MELCAAQQQYNPRTDAMVFGGTAGSQIAATVATIQASHASPACCMLCMVCLSATWLCPDAATQSSQPQIWSLATQPMPRRWTRCRA